jgi:hypothetical protein
VARGPNTTTEGDPPLLNAEWAKTKTAV